MMAAMKALIVDFSRVLIFANDEQVASLNEHHRRLSAEPGYSLFDHFRLNHELLGYLGRLKDRVPLYIFTINILY
jgi:hypothetical protein